MSGDFVKWIINEVIGKKIYLNRGQCFDFKIEYMDSDSFDLRADDIFTSRQWGYDMYHRSMLVGLGRSIIKAERVGYKPNLKRREFNSKGASQGEGFDSPGWYVIKDVKMHDGDWIKGEV